MHVRKRLLPMAPPLFPKNRLFCPGPTPVPEAGLIASLNINEYHRSSAFEHTFKTCRDWLAPFFGTSELPLILAASGTGAMEAAVANLTGKDDPVLVVNAGKFGERWQKICSAYQCKVQCLEVPYGKAPSPKDLIKCLEASKEKPKAIFLQANETSTGVFFPLEEITRTLRQSYDGLIVVDAISALVAHEIKMDDWQIDCVVGGSQKGFGVAPGLSFIGLSKRAWRELSKRPRFYFDLLQEAKGQVNGRAAFTPATTLIQSLHASLKILNEQPLEAIFEHHRRCANAVRAAAKAINLEPFVTENFSHALTAITVPDQIDAQQLIKLIRSKDGAILAGGQGNLKGKIIRVAHLGFMDRLSLISGISALEFGLAELNHSFSLGAGVSAAMQILK